MQTNRKNKAAVMMALSLFMLAGGCGNDTVIRRAGQNELFAVDIDNERDVKLTLPGSGSMNWTQYANRPKDLVLRQFGDPIRKSQDVIAVQVLSVHLQDVYHNLPVPPDVMLFSEVWENGAAGYASESLNRIIYTAQSQAIPARLNFEGNLAYGPTGFKGHPLKIRFTLMVLQKRQGQKAASAVDVVANFASATAIAAPYAGFASQAVSVIREIFRSLPDVNAFDFETTLLSDEPEKFTPLVLDGTKGASNRTETANAIKSLTADLAAGKIDRDKLDLVKARVTAMSAVGSTADRKAFETAVAKYEAVATEAQFQAESLAKIAKVTPPPGVSTGGQLGGPPVKVVDVAKWTSFKAAAAEAQVTDAVSPTKADYVVRFDQKLGELSSSIKDVEKATNALAEEVLPSQEQWPWLRYGVYAIVQTHPRNEGGTACIIPLDAHMRFEGGRLCFIEESKRTNGTLEKRATPVPTNYIVFAIVPKQLAEDNSVLTAASTADRELLNTLRQTQDNAAGATKEIKSFATKLAERIARAQAEELARTIVGSMEKAGSLDLTEFQSRFDKAWDGFVKGVGDAVDAKTLETIKSEVREKWSNMIKDKKPSGSEKSNG